MIINNKYRQQNTADRLQCVNYLRPFHVLDPLERLALWVDHEWPSSTTSYYHSILGGEAITWKTLDVPVPYSRRVHHEVTELKLFADRNHELLELSDPDFIDQLLAVVGQERTHV